MALSRAGDLAWLRAPGTLGQVPVRVGVSYTRGCRFLHLQFFLMKLIRIIFLLLIECHSVIAKKKKVAAVLLTF